MLMRSKSSLCAKRSAIVQRLINGGAIGACVVLSIAIIRPTFRHRSAQPAAHAVPVISVELLQGPPGHGDFDPPTPDEVLVDNSTSTAAPATVQVMVDGRGLQDAQIGPAIQHGVDFLFQQFRDGQVTIPTDVTPCERDAMDALCVYALVTGGQAITDRRLGQRSDEINKLLDKLCGLAFVGDGKSTNPPVVYGRSLRACALAAFNRPKDRKVLKADVDYLIASQLRGGYSYDDTGVQLARSGINMVEDDPNGGPPTVKPAPASGLFGKSAPSYDVGAYGKKLSPLPPVQWRMDQVPGQPGQSAIPAQPAQGGYKQIERPLELNNRSRAWYPDPRPVANWDRPIMIHVDPPRRIDGAAKAAVLIPSKGPTAKAFASSGGGKAQMGSNAGVGPRTGPVSDLQTPPADIRVQFPWDNFNSQYGLLGVWAGAEVGMEVPDSYWQSVEYHWTRTQLKTGEWTFKRNEPTGYFSMTCGGVVSLLVTHEYLDLAMLRGTIARLPYSPSLAAGLHWLERGDNGVNTPNPNTDYLGYDLFGMERVGLASGYKYYGKHDWYREMAERALASQYLNGSWGHADHGVDTLIDTAYTILFLSRGRHPIVMTKLRFDGTWNNRPRDVANLTKFASRELERPLNWQVVDVEHPWYDWFDSPVAFIASNEAPRMTERNYYELRSFAEAGGLIFTQTDNSQPAFDKWVIELAAKIAPGRPLEVIPETDPIYTIQYKLKSHRKLMGVNNGVRWLIVHSPSDVAMAWQQRSDKTKLADYQLGMNVFLYASGKPDLKNRLASPYIPEPSPSAATIPIARVSFKGNWDPEPAAWARFSRYLRWETGASLQLGVVSADKLIPGIAPIAALTGTGAVAFSDADVKAIHDYIADGGVLLVDPCGGDTVFRTTVRQALLDHLLTEAKPMTIAQDSPLLQNITGGSGTIPLRVRPFTAEKFGKDVAGIEVLTLGKGALVISPRDLTFGLLGVQTWGVDGYQSEAAQTFVRNLVQWTSTR